MQEFMSALLLAMSHVACVSTEAGNRAAYPLMLTVRIIKKKKQQRKDFIILSFTQVQ